MTRNKDIADHLVATYEIGSARIHIFGKDPDNFDWRLYGPNGFAVWPQHVEAIKHIGWPESPSGDPTQTYGPNCSTFNAKVIEPCELVGKAPRDNLLFRYGGQGSEAAGLILPKGSAVMFATADCPTVVATDPTTGEVVSAHAGLNELINRGPIRRPHNSVIGEILRRFKRDQIENLLVGIYCGIGSRHFYYSPDHPQWGDKNRQLIQDLRRDYRTHADLICEADTGRINLKELISRQLELGGICRTQIKLCPLDTYDNDRLWSHGEEVAKGERGEPSNPLARNLVLVTNW